MNVTVRLHGWADSLTGNQKIIFALQLALANAGYGIGYDIKFSTKCLNGNHVVYKPWEFQVTATTITSRGWNCKTDTISDETKDEYIFQFIAESYSVRSIYLGALKVLKDRRKTKKLRWECITKLWRK